jgi:hypothetical protein
MEQVLKQHFECFPLYFARGRSAEAPMKLNSQFCGMIVPASGTMINVIAVVFQKNNYRWGGVVSRFRRTGQLQIGEQLANIMSITLRVRPAPQGVIAIS